MVCERRRCAKVRLKPAAHSTRCDSRNGLGRAHFERDVSKVCCSMSMASRRVCHIALAGIDSLGARGSNLLQHAIGESPMCSPFVISPTEAPSLSISARAPNELALKELL